MVGCLATNCVTPDKAVWRQHVRIIRRLRELEEGNCGLPLHVTEVCAALRVNARTLHHICAVMLGMGPKKYLLLRRLQLAHDELRKAHPGKTTVTAVATG